MACGHFNASPDRIKLIAQGGDMRNGKHTLRYFILATLLLLGVVWSLSAAEENRHGGYPNNDLLATPQWLQQHIGDNGLSDADLAQRSNPAHGAVPGRPVQAVAPRAAARTALTPQASQHHPLRPTAAWASTALRWLAQPVHLRVPRAHPVRSR